MKPETSYLLVITSQGETTQQIQRIFAMERRYHIRFAGTCQEGMQIAGRDNQNIDLVLIDDTIADASALETIRKLAILLPTVPIVAIAQQNAVAYVREALLAGARAFLTKPLLESDVITSVNQLLQLENARRQQAQDGGRQGRKSKVITVISPKGGAGATMLAVNLALTLREQTGKEVILLDGHASLGDLDAALNLQSQFTCADLIGHGVQIDAEMLDGVLTPHESGLRVLVSSQDLEDADYISPEMFDRIIQHASHLADFVVVDAGSLVEAQTASALSSAHDVLLVVTPEVTALRRAALFLKAAEQNGFPREKIQLVVNREGVNGGIATEDISQHLNMQVAAAIPDDPGLVIYTMNRGISLLQHSPRSAMAKRIQRLAEELSPKVKERAAESQSLFGRLSTMLRSNPA